jgi:hypothetical protein
VAGDDTYSGRNWDGGPERSGPVETIAKALRLAQFGDRIVLANTGQPYRESISLVGSRHSGSAPQPLVIAGNGAILDGSAPVPLDAWEHYQGAVFRFQPRVLGHQQLFLNDRPVPMVPAGGLRDRPPALRPLEATVYQGAIYFCVEQGKIPRDYPLAYAQQQTGITLYQVEHVALVDLVVQGFRVDGINAANSARHVQLLGVVCRGNGRAGIVVGGASLVDIEACTVGYNGQAQVLTLPYSETHVRNCNLSSETAPGWVDQGGRFFLGQKLVEGGLEQVRPQP